jgi:hypothetical protein
VGEEIESEDFQPADYERFGHRLKAELEAFAELIRRPGFGSGPPSVGAELEVSLVDSRGRPAPVNAEVLRDAPGEALALELDRFNLECETPPAPLEGRPFEAVADELEDALDLIAAAAAAHGARPATIGILPTLRTDDLGSAALSDSVRFRALARALRSLHEGPFRVRIQGAEPLELDWDDVTLEGAATALHVHLRVTPAAFAATFNAAQAACGPVLAVAGNSPLLLGHLLWEETRVPLFHQAIDDRAEAAVGWRPSRASFGHGWVQSGAAELFVQSATLHAPILPVVRDDDDPLTTVRRGEVPPLDALRLHQGTVWSWTRPVYAPGIDPHLRIELRALPSGPTVADMAANAAFLVGLTLALAPEVDWLTAALPFDLARRNFYAAARRGLNATLLWPSREPPSPRPHLARELVPVLLPLARRGLTEAGVAEEESGTLLQIVAERAASGRTGAVWQRESLALLARRTPRPGALRALLEEYLVHAAGGDPVHAWPLAC